MEVTNSIGSEVEIRVMSAPSAGDQGTTGDQGNTGDQGTGKSGTKTGQTQTPGNEDTGPINPDPNPERGSGNTIPADSNL